LWRGEGPHKKMGVDVPGHVGKKNSAENIRGGGSKKGRRSIAYTTPSRGMKKTDSSRDAATMLVRKGRALNEGGLLIDDSG